MSDKDPMQVRCEGDQEEEPEPPRTRAVAASGADAVDLSAAPRVIKVKDHLHARVDEIECYIRVDKKARTAGVFHVALCKQSYARGKGRARCRQLRSSRPLSRRLTYNIIHVNNSKSLNKRTRA